MSDSYSLHYIGRGGTTRRNPKGPQDKMGAEARVLAAPPRSMQALTRNFHNEKTPNNHVTILSYFAHGVVAFGAKRGEQET